jgi:hypothetical protein
MAVIVFKCPTIGLQVQGWLADDASDHCNTYFPVRCEACKQMHYVNPATSRVLGGDDDDE